MFFTYNQNNSGGEFIFDKDRGITHFVIVEADSPQDADDRAEKIGLYFDGYGDCPCCGYRWYSQFSSEEGDEEPSIYGRHPRDFVEKKKVVWMDEGFEVAVHHKDGKIEWF